MDGQVGEQIGGPIEGWRMEEWRKGGRERERERWREGGRDEWRARWTGGRVDGRMDGQMVKQPWRMMNCLTFHELILSRLAERPSLSLPDKRNGRDCSLLATGLR